jgi:hypothetical protein
MLVTDPYSDNLINVTGWDLDHLAELLITLREAIAGAPDTGRSLTREEVSVLLTSEAVPGLPDDRRTWWTDDAAVKVAVERLGAVVDEALYQRDLPLAMKALYRSSAELPAPLAAAYDRYIRELDERP